jgi:hypothetical protein
MEGENFNIVFLILFCVSIFFNLILIGIIIKMRKNGKTETVEN